MDIENFDSRFKTLEVKKIIKECPTVNTYVFEYPLGAKPGQFVMIWLPGVDEKPMSVAYDDGKEFWVTICKVGPFSEAVHALKEGDKVGVRGPLGTVYDFKEGEHLALVSGGYGSAPMYFIANEAVKKGCKVDFFIGAREKDLLIYTDRVESLGDVELHVSTDDGSVGHKGYVTQLLEKEMESKKFDRVFTCGPELMMRAAGEIADKAGINCQMSVERYMKCGIGVCGQCSLDPTGDLVCRKGSVMNYKYVKGLDEFGKYHRDAQGKKHYF